MLLFQSGDLGLYLAVKQVLRILMVDVILPSFRFGLWPYYLVAAANHSKGGSGFVRAPFLSFFLRFFISFTSCL